jgi:carbon-monoxide dehydrogenase medium subunit
MPLWSRFLTPADLPAALQLLQQYGPRARVFAGGTDLVLDMTSGRCSPAEAVVDISCLPELQGIRLENGIVTIGSAVTFAQILHSDLLCAGTPVLTGAARTVAGPQIRNSATLGGNVVNASPAADAIPPLLSLDTTVCIAGSGGSFRSVALEDFVVGVRKVDLLPGEIVTAFRFPLPTAAVRQYFRKVQPRRAMAIAILNLALLIEVSDGFITTLRIAMGAVAPKALRLHAVEQALMGKPVASTIEAGPYALISDEIRPISDFRASRSYRTRVAEHLLRESLTGLLA